MALQFNAANVTPVSMDFSPLPAGEYLVKGIEAEMKSNKAGTGEYLAMTFEVMQGEHANRKVWHNFNLSHNSEKVAQIGQGELAALCQAINRMAITDESQLLHTPFMAKLKIKHEEGREPSNAITKFSPATANAQPAMQQQPMQQPQQQPQQQQQPVQQQGGMMWGNQ